MNARANKRRVMRRFYGRFHAPFTWLSAEDRAWLNMTESRAMELLNLDRTGLQVMMEEDDLIRTPTDYDSALRIVSRLIDADPERGTPDGHRLEVLGALVQRYEARHFSFGSSTSAGQVLAYEPDDGPLTEMQLEQIRKAASKQLPTAGLLSRKHSLV